MRAITIFPEWAWAICHLDKRIENRVWSNRWIVGERIAIHAGLNIGGVRSRPAFEPAIRAMIDEARRAGWEPRIEWFGARGDEVRRRTFTDRPLYKTMASGVFVRPGGRIASQVFDSTTLPTMAIVATAVVDFIDQSWAKMDLHPDALPPWGARGQYHWYLRDVEVLADPVPCKGRQRLWKVPEEVEAILHAS